MDSATSLLGSISGPSLVTTSVFGGSLVDAKRGGTEILLGVLRYEGRTRASSCLGEP